MDACQAHLGSLALPAFAQRGQKPKERRRVDEQRNVDGLDPARSWFAPVPAENGQGQALVTAAGLACQLGSGFGSAAAVRR